MLTLGYIIPKFFSNNITHNFVADIFLICKDRRCAPRCSHSTANESSKSSEYADWRSFALEVVMGVFIIASSVKKLNFSHNDT